MTEGKGFVARRQERESAKALKKLIKQVEDGEIIEVGDESKPASPQRARV